MSNTISCLVLMPFGKTPEEQLISRMIYKEVIVPAFDGLEIAYHRIDTQTLLDRPISAEVEQQLRTTALTIVDLSGNNANVYYELGFRRAHGKRFICIARDTETAFYGRQYQVINYAAASAAESIREALIHYMTELQDESEAGESLDGLVDDLRTRRFVNPFQARTAEWRVRRTATMIAGIANSDWNLDTLSPSEYAVYIFGSLVGLLRDGEEYCTVSNSRFWANSDINRSTFLSVNIDAVLQAGVNIRRVILVPKRDLDDRTHRENIRQVLEKHSAGVREAATSGRGQMSVKVKVVDELTDALRRYGHFAVARAVTPGRASDRGGMVIVPRYNNWIDAESISTIRLLFSKGSVRHDPDTRDYLERFEAAWTGAVDVDVVLAEWFGTSSA